MAEEPDADRILDRRSFLRRAATVGVASYAGSSCASSSETTRGGSTQSSGRSTHSADDTKSAADESSDAQNDSTRRAKRSSKTSNRESAAGEERPRDTTEEGQPASDSDSNQLSCTDTQHLDEQEQNVRRSLKYRDHSDEPTECCERCQMWEPPNESDACGGCHVVPGPIHPDGFCTAWVQSS